MSHDQRPAEAGEGVRVPARLSIFGYDPATVDLVVIPRSRRWRMLGAARTMGIALLLTPVAALVPPHAPWALGVLGVGAILARRRWQERYTVVGVEGACPKCGAELEVGRGRLRTPHPLPCESCHHEGSAEVATSDLPDPGD